MQVSLENTANLERRLTVSLPAERLDGVVGERLREIARTANIKGFRRGKVPTKVIEQRYGQQVRSEAYGELVRNSLGEALRQEKLQPAGNPEVKVEASGDDGEIRFTATFEVVPDFGDIDVSKLQIKRAVAHVEDADIDSMIETLRLQRRTWSVVERPAQKDDLVQVETSAQTDSDRVPAEGSEKGQAIIGSGMMFPALEEQLVGMSAGESRVVEASFPAEWRVAALAGKTAKVEMKVLAVSEAHLPAVDAEFVKSFGIRNGNVEQFRKEVRANLERELRGNLMSRLRAEVSTRLVEAYAHVEMPPRLVDAEARSLAANAEQNARRAGQKDVVVAPEQFAQAARNRITAALLVGEVARRNQLVLDHKRLSETLQLIASTYEQPEQVIELYRNDPNLMSNLQNRVMEEQVIDWIAERASATDYTLTFTEAMRPA